MSKNRAQLSQQARAALARGDMASVQAIARNLVAGSPYYPDGHYLAARAALAQRRIAAAVQAYKECLRLDKGHLEAVVELADVLLKSGEHGQSFSILKKNGDALIKTSRMSFTAADLFSRLGMHQDAFAFYKSANVLQPGVPNIEAGLAACATKNGEFELAQELYAKLLEANPGNQRNHYEFSRLRRAESRAHVDQMLSLISKAEDGSSKAASNQIFMHFAIAKELEDLEEWETSFKHYCKGAEMAARECAVAGYSVVQDIEALQVCQEVFTKEWLDGGDKLATSTVASSKSPIFVVGLPRTGTTLVERILASHPQIDSADETFFMQVAVATLSNTRGQSLADTLKAAADISSDALANHYLHAVEYRIGEQPMFVDKYPFNFHYLGLIARAIPNAKIVLLERDPMDACVAMFKQPYFKYSYRLDDLADYYLAYRRLMAHWDAVIPNIHILKYEELIGNTSSEIDRLLSFVGVEVDPVCYRFYEQGGASATASSVQIRERVHSRSVGKWRNWQKQLKLLNKRLQSN